MPRTSNPPAISSLTALVRWPQADPPPRRVVLENVPFPPRRRAPDKGLSLYFGMRKVHQEVAEEFRQAEQHGEAMSLVAVRVAVHRPKVPVAARWEEIPKLGMVHLGRLNADAGRRLATIWRELMAGAGDAASFTEKDWRRLLPIARHPHLVYPLWRREPFRQLDVIVYPVETPDGQIVHRATLFRTRTVREIEAIGYPLSDPDIRIPKGSLPRTKT